MTQVSGKVQTQPDKAAILILKRYPVQHVENICKGSRRLFLLRCNQYFFHRSLNAPKPVVLSLSKAGKAIASIAAPFWGCPVMNCKAKPPSHVMT